MATSTDDFNRANAPLGSDWTVLTTGAAMQIASNAASTGDPTTSDQVETWNAVSFGNDQFSELQWITIPDGGAETGFGPGVRWDTGTVKTGYWMVCNTTAGNDTFIAKMVSGSYTLLAQGDVNWAVNDVARLEIEGTTLRCKKNGIQQFTTTDAAISSGRPALCYSSTTSSPSVDNWQGGDIGGAATTAPPKPTVLSQAVTQAASW
jgi:hypothetical protein